MNKSGVENPVGSVQINQSFPGYKWLRCAQLALVIIWLVLNLPSARAQGSIQVWSEVPGPSLGLTNISLSDGGYSGYSFTLWTNSLSGSWFTPFTFDTIPYGDIPSTYLGVLGANWSSLLSGLQFAWATNGLAAVGPSNLSWSQESGISLPLPPPGTIPDHALELVQPIPHRVKVGVPVGLSAVSNETNALPVSVDFLLGQAYSFDSGSQSGVVMFSGYSVLPTIQVVESLGRATPPDYAITWVPSQPGNYYLWAHSTSQLGAVRETAKQPITVCAANDDFTDATVILPSVRATNFVFSTFWGSTETNEPAHAGGAAARSLWWQWTPSYSGKVNLKAVRNLIGLSVDVFTGSELTNLQWVADNRRSASIPGKSGIIRLRVEAGKTYFIRVDEDARYLLPSQPVGCGRIPADSTFTLEPANTPLPGELNFSLLADSHMDGQGNLVVVPFARVFQSDGQTPVNGLQYWAQIYVGITPSTLNPVGSPQQFYPDGSTQTAGLFEPAPVVIPSFVAGDRVLVQIRVWDSTFGRSFEVARANGGSIGCSRISSVTLGSEAVGPLPLFGIKSFTLHSAEGLRPGWRLQNRLDNR